MISTQKDALKFMSDLDAQAKSTQSFSYVARFTAKAGQVTTSNISIADGSDFQQLGYNIEYQEAADKKEYLRLKFTQKALNRSWSNDFEPIKSIATPGVRSASPVARYGFRNFPALLKGKDQLTIQCENTSAEDLEVSIVLVGSLWFKA